MNWYVVRRKRLIVSGPVPVTEPQAREMVDRWNSLLGGAEYEAISEDEARARTARQVKWSDDETGFGKRLD